MAMISPCPRYSSKGLNCPVLPAGQSLDYSLSSPLGANEPLCKHTVPFPTLCATWTAGQQVSVQFAPGGAPHGGGHCQYSLSYDGGNTFVVVEEVRGYCFGKDSNQRDYTFTLPSTLPSSDKAVFAWSWVNAIGNREFYMNCADVAIKGGSGTYTGKQMTIANYAGYPTIPEFRGNYATGLELYDNAKNITVSGNGSTSGLSGSSSSSASSYSSTQASTTTMTSSALGTPAKHAYSIVTVAPLSTYPASSSASEPSNSPVYPTSEPPLISTPVNTVGACTGNMQCTPDGSGFKYCLYGKWTSTMACPQGTKCKQQSDWILCDWP
ncbi:hypothetical protein IW150_000513 [Coemansia sp. RSA 2607]|nr:hypothetical protein IW150_000513 [Coemansia sp. RSA 2607]